MKESFNNYFDPSKNYDSFNGTELKCYIKVTTEYDEFGQTKKFELVELGMLSAISAVEQFSLKPIPAIGHSKPIGIQVGSSIVVGSATFEIFEHGFAKEVQRVLKEAGISKTNFTYDSENKKLNIGYSDVKEIHDFPLVDLLIIGVKENSPNKKIQKEILGVRFNRNGSGIGLNQLGVKEQYTFLAQEMSDFKPLEGVKEELENTQDDFDDSIFG